MPAFENRARMSLEDAEVRLSNPPSGGIHYVVANEDGSFSIAGHHASSEPEKLEEAFYDTVVLATNKTTTSPGDFVHRVQTAAAEPITLRKLIQHLIDTYRPPRTKKDPRMVIRVRTRDAYTRLGYLRQVDCCNCEGRERPPFVASGRAAFADDPRQRYPGRAPSASATCRKTGRNGNDAGM